VAAEKNKTLQKQHVGQTWSHSPTRKIHPKHKRYICMYKRINQPTDRRRRPTHYLI